MNPQSKSQYEPPKIKDLGTIADLTKAQDFSGQFDNAFQIGDPIPDPPNIAS